MKSAKLVDWLKKDGRTNSSAVVEGGTSGAKKAILSYEVLETWKNKEDAQDCGERNLIRIDLDTGRHHQIRVQMAHAGMPLVGDRKYNPGQNSQEPLALCSAKLGFQHPVTKKQLEFQVQLQVWHSKDIDIAQFLMYKSEKCVKSLDEFRKVCIM